IILQTLVINSSKSDLLSINPISEVDRMCMQSAGSVKMVKRIMVLSSDVNVRSGIHHVGDMNFLRYPVNRRMNR
ncbi:MAG: hypothetical protein M0P29_13205, partial [Sphaerochaetaceae bacterium]|nr:hypothetical protein [Sphaerochaetaceae bacterium]